LFKVVLSRGVGGQGKSKITSCAVSHLVLAFVSAIPPKDCQVKRQLAGVFIKIASSFAFLHTHAESVTPVS